MDKATVESVMAKAMMLVGALGDSCEAATSLPFLEAVTALRAEVERLAAQAAPTDADRASSGATTAAPFAKDSWQHAVDNQLVGFGRTSQEFANPHEAMAWLAEMHMELGQSNAGKRIPASGEIGGV